jgi:hypothetical protein
LLAVLLYRWMCTAVKDGILMPQPLNLTGGYSGTLLVRHQTCTLLHDCPSGVVLKVEQVMCVPGQQSHPGVEVRTLEVGHGLKTLLPYEVLLIPNWEKRDRQCCSSDEVVLAQGGESDVCHQLNAGVGLTSDDGPRPRLCGVEGYRHTDLALVHAVGCVQSSTVYRRIPVVAKTDESVV